MNKKVKVNNNKTPKNNIKTTKDKKIFIFLYIM